MSNPAPGHLHHNASGLYEFLTVLGRQGVFAITLAHVPCSRSHPSTERHRVRAISETGEAQGGGNRLVSLIAGEALGQLCVQALSFANGVAASQKSQAMRFQAIYQKVKVCFF